MGNPSKKTSFLCLFRRAHRGSPRLNGAVSGLLVGLCAMVLMRPILADIPVTAPSPSSPPSSMPPVSKPPAPRPTVWMMPPGNDHGARFRELFAHPEQWAQTRTKIDGIGLADWQTFQGFLGRRTADVGPVPWPRGTLKLSLEVGAVKPWGQTGESAFNRDRQNFDKYIRDGGKIDSIAMDEPLITTRFFIHQPDAYAVEQTADFIQLVRQNYPDIRIGDIEGYPAISYDDLTKWIDALQARLKEKNVKGLDFMRFDVDWVNFVSARRGSWPELKKLEMFCHARHLPFSLVYWAADYPALRNKGIANDATWYVLHASDGERLHPGRRQTGRSRTRKPGWPLLPKSSPKQTRGPSHARSSISATRFSNKLTAWQDAGPEAGEPSHCADTFQT